MTNKLIIPKIKNCYCGSDAKIQTWDIYGEYIYQVICKNSHVLTKFCGTKNRAVCRWNNRVQLNKN